MCSILSLSRTVYYYSPSVNYKDNAVIAELLRLSEDYHRYGFGKLYHLIRRQGFIWNHKRVYQICCALKLNMKRKGKRRLPNREPEPLAVPEEVNKCWSIDFMSDSLYDGRRFRTFNVVDDYNRELLTIEIDLNLPSERVTRVLDRVASWRGYPAKLRMDNGPEFISGAMAEWAEKYDVKLEFIQPGKPFQNSFIERFNRTYRSEVLDFYIYSAV